jgi:multicomponent K+:H+ antiporter subunit D
MSHWIVAPILLPLFAATLLLLSARLSLELRRIISVGATLALVGTCIVLLAMAREGAYHIYALGNWPAPFGIVLVLDRLSALMVVLTGITGLFSVLYAVQGSDARGGNYHALFQLQLMGLNGAFLTGDLFNLFVFFEVLLIASYGLLLHGGGRDRIKAGVHYVVFNLAGSSLFLIAVGILYGITGTLNMADLAVKVAATAPDAIALVRAGALILFIVFAVKAALLPLYFWLPDTYSGATGPVAALFAIMTKVGVYAILRVFTLIFGSGADGASDIALPWLLPLALGTLILASGGVLACRQLRRLVAYLVVASVGTMLTGVGLFTLNGIQAALYYMAHSTLIIAALFLLADQIASQRGETSDRLESAASVSRPMLLGTLFFLGAVGVVGLPPLSGFIGKLLLLEAAMAAAPTFWIWAVVLGTGLLALVALGRAGSVLFWKASPGEPNTAMPITLVSVFPAAGLLAGSLLLSAAAEPVGGFAYATAQQLLHPAGYVEAVLRRQEDAH